MLHHRRHFLQGVLATGASALLPDTLRAETKTARVMIDPTRRKADIDRRLFGSFLEHIGRAIYTGIYDPGSKQADANGFRKDVLEETRRLAVPCIRYPGGNFVSGYHWQDGVGPRSRRPQLLDRAWNSIETNQFGTDEFIAWCRQVNTEPVLTVNLGTGDAVEAAAWVEYCNAEKDTRWSELRRKNGSEKPHNVRLWCLGNEMDTTLQLGHMSAVEYGRKAADAARQMKAVDRSLQLVACGSTSPGMPTWLEWDRQVLEQCYNEVEAISLHRYLGNSNETGGDSRKFLALNLSMDRQIQDVAAVCDMVRSRLRSRKRLWLSFDEWNVWYRDRDYDGRRRHAPPILEEVYNLEDALLVGGMLNTLIRNADRIRLACQAQLVNVIALMLTNADQFLRQTIYYPYAQVLQNARGHLLDVWVESPTYTITDLGPIPYLDVACTLDAKAGECCLLILNRDLVNEQELKLIWRDSPPRRVLHSQTITGPDLKMTNTFDQPSRVTSQPFDFPQPGPEMNFKLPARSYTVIRLSLN